MREISVLNQKISYMQIKDEDYISITDMLKSKDGNFFISDWLRNRNTIEFLGIWEEIHNPNFNYGEFAIIKSQAGLNSYKISAKEWISKTNAIGIISKTGRYGGTYAHKDIAFEFGMWISPKFKLLLIKEFERLKSEEQKLIGWNAKRELAKLNYRVNSRRATHFRIWATGILKEFMTKGFNLVEFDQIKKYHFRQVTKMILCE